MRSSPIGGQWYLTLRFFFAALRLCVKTVVLRSNLTKKTRRCKDAQSQTKAARGDITVDSAMVLKNTYALALFFNRLLVRRV